MKARLKNHIYVIGNQKLLFRDGEITGGFSDLLSNLESKGFILSKNPFSEFLLALDHNEQGYREYLKRGGRLSNSVLIRLEPSAVLPFQYKKKTLKKYGKVITPGGVKKHQNTQDFFLPYPYRFADSPLAPKVSDAHYLHVLKENINLGLFEIKNWQERPIQIAMITSNKVGANFKNNYGERRKIARFSSKYGISVFGTKWDETFTKSVRYRLAIIKNSVLNYQIPNIFAVFSSVLSRYPNTKGEISDRNEVLRTSKFTIIIENSNEAITEKIFDCMLFGSIPVYMGPNLAEFLIPQASFIKLGRDLKSTLNGLSRLSLLEVQEKLEEMQNFIGSMEFAKKYSAQSVFNMISEDIELFLSVEKSAGN